MANTYYKRICDQLLADKLEAKGAVLVKGAKWCGKTTTAAHIARSAIYIEDPSKKKQYLEMAEINPVALLQGEVPHLLDEWQLAPKLWDAVRFEVDRRDEFGQFILTGSAVPPDDSQISHTGTGRITSLLMRPMSLFESGDSNGSVSLRALFSKEHDINGMSDLSLDDIAYLICRGGWPKAIGRSKKVALAQAPDYFDAVVESDISKRWYGLCRLMPSCSRRLLTLRIRSIHTGRRLMWILVARWPNLFLYNLQGLCYDFL